MSTLLLDVFYLTNDLPQHLVVTLAVYLLGGANKYIDTEDVAAKAYELAPERFRWRKYPQYPNLELVRVFLSDAKKPDKGHLLDGSGRRGWTLTPAGLRWALESAESAQASGLARTQGRSKAGSIDTQRADREMSRIHSTLAWKKWTEGDPTLSKAESRDVFRIDSYSRGEMATSKVDRLLKLFITDDELFKFLETIAPLALQEDDPND